MAELPVLSPDELRELYNSGELPSSSPRAIGVSRIAHIPSSSPLRASPRFTMTPAREAIREMAEEQYLEDKSYLTLLARLYGLEVTQLPDYPVIPFDDLRQQFASGNVLNYGYEPVYQPWAGSPGTPNRVLSVMLRTGQKVLSIGSVRPNPRTGKPEFNPPV